MTNPKKEELEERLRQMSLEYRAIEKQLAKINKGERDAERKALSKDKCKCGHIRGVHGRSFSPNYSDGACGDCKCRNFLMV